MSGWSMQGFPGWEWAAIGTVALVWLALALFGLYNLLEFIFEMWASFGERRDKSFEERTIKRAERSFTKQEKRPLNGKRLRTSAHQDLNVILEDLRSIRASSAYYEDAKTLANGIENILEIAFSSLSRSRDG